MFWETKTKVENSSRGMLGFPRATSRIHRGGTPIFAIEAGDALSVLKNKGRSRRFVEGGPVLPSVDVDVDVTSPRDC